MSTQLEDEVRDAFARAAAGTASSAELFGKVRALVLELRKDGEQPETVVVAMKGLCGVSQLTIAADTDSSVDSSEGRKLSDMVIRTAIEEYYSSTVPAGRRPWQGYSLEIGDELRQV
mgnify:CR=1 FL=1